MNGKMQHSGPCFSCRGTGKQSSPQIKRNRAYNRHKIAAIAGSDRGFDPGELAMDNWAAEHCPSDNT